MRVPAASSFAAVLATLLVVPAWAAEPPESRPTFGASLALRAYANRVSSAGYVGSGITGIDPVSANVVSDATTYIPSLGLRYGRWIASGSYFTNTRYSFYSPEVGRNLRFERREWDVNVGYAVLPSLVLTVGYKELKAEGIEGNPALEQRYRGPTVGLAASAPLAQSWSLYGNLAVGRLKHERAGEDLPRGNYFTGEFGVQYALRALAPGMANASLLLGYRSQSIRSKNVPTGFFLASPSGTAATNAAVDTKNTSDGFVIGLNVSF